MVKIINNDCTTNCEVFGLSRDFGGNTIQANFRESWWPTEIDLFLSNVRAVADEFDDVLRELAD
jgi:hypothetical protein